jgi:hypothetical protein
MQNKPKFGEVARFQWIEDHIPFDIDTEKEYLRAKQELQLMLKVPVSKRSLPKPVEPAEKEPPKIKHDIQRFDMTKEEWRKKADEVMAKERAEWERSRNQNPSIPVEQAALAKDEKPESPPPFINCLEPGPDNKVHYTPLLPETTREGKPIELSPIKGGNKTAPNLALAPVCSNSVTTSSARGSETPAAASPNPECDAESVKSVLAKMASRSIVPSPDPQLGFFDDNGSMIWIRVTKREKGLVAEFEKRGRVIATFDESELEAELKKARMYL